MRPAHFHRSHHAGSRIVFGLGVIGFGVLALLDNLNVFGLPLLRTFWPLVFVLLGLARLARPCHVGSALFALGLMLLGGLLTARNLGYVDFSPRNWWPVLIILVGLSVLARGLFPRRRQAGFPASTLEHGDQINIDASFSAVSQRCDSRSLKGGRIASTFGGVELDLTQAVIDGTEARLDVSAHFSGIELRVPRDWLVVVEVTSTFGGVEDKTVPPMTPGPRLLLRGEVMFGGVEVKN
ncbi:MAG: cell wall-active antibiotics response protein [Comamonadaceae bacterium]|jgi:predicted membrane protein|nr:cell wall-active antibiotics response protein [Comamonadaceae bacterium]